MISIALCGAGGTGKGTIVKELCSRPEYYFAPLRSPVEKIGRRWSPDSVDYKSMPTAEKKRMQYCIVSAQMAIEDQARDIGANFIAERSIIDYLPYMMKFCSMVEYTHYSSCIMDYIMQNPYDILVHVPIEFETDPKAIDFNSWKERDNTARAQTALLLEDMIKDISRRIPSMRIVRVTGTPAERVDTIIEVCSKIIFGSF